MDPNRPEAIYVPYLEIDYEEKATEAIYENDLAKEKRVFFISEYTMEESGFWKLARTTFWILFMIMVIIFAILTHIYMGQEKEAGRSNSILLFINSTLNLFEIFSTLYFWYLYAMTGWWFIFFKF